MTKQEFLTVLQETLSAELNYGQVNEQIAYYSQYIEEQKASGRAEEEVVAELGDARALAKNVIDGLIQTGGGHQQSTYEYEDEDGNIYERMTATYTREDGSAEPSWQEKAKVYATLAAIVVVILVVLALITRLIIFLLPSIIIIGLVMWLFRKLDGR